jgi:hypothetical protein
MSFRQVYISPGVCFPFSAAFQRYLSAQVSELVDPSPLFTTKYGDGFKLIFNVSAKGGILESEIRGPAVFRRTSDVEFTVFLPFDVIGQAADPIRAALEHLLDGFSVGSKSMPPGWRPAVGK